MDIKKFVKMLPCIPSKKHINSFEYGAAEAYDEMKKGFLYFKRELIVINDAMAEAFGPYAGHTKNVYGAKCMCSRCGHTFYGNYQNSNKRKAQRAALILAESYDSIIFEGYVNPDEENVSIYYPGNEIFCQNCEWLCEISDKDYINDEKSDIYFADEEFNVKNLRSQEILNIDGYTTVITWQHRKVSSFFECDEYDWEPVQAVVVDERGEILTFCYFDGWSLDLEMPDGLQELYRYDGAFNDMLVGGFINSNVPDLTGTTGERTGLVEYIENHGDFPVTYLKSWSLNHNLENIIKSDFGNIVTGFFDNIINENIQYEIFPTEYIDDFSRLGIDIEKESPRKMFGMSRNEFAEFCKTIETVGEAETFNLVKDSGIGLSDFKRIYKKYGPTILASWRKKAYQIRLEKIDRYLQKQNLDNKTGFELWIDYFNFLNENEINDVIFPKNLRKAHNRITATKNLIKNREVNSKFKKVFEKYKGLEWSDGELAVFLPQNQEELIEEGRVLNHCVGRYVEEHSQGQRIIFFVRHKKRPERSYYTLNISFEGKKPRQLQLHGYGNERHGPNKEYTHSIPKKVTDFVQRWTDEVLLPWNVKRNKSGI